MAIAQRLWSARVETRNGHYVVEVTRGEEPAGMITFEEEDSLDDAMALASTILSLNKRDG